MDKQQKIAALKTLRERTKAGVMDCQKALSQAQFDIDKALDLLYIKTEEKVKKLSKNETTERFVFGSTNAEKDTGVVLQISCQTDFVGNNQDFTRLAHEILQIALENKPQTVAELCQAKIQNKTVQQLINFWIAAFGENIIISDYIILQEECVNAFIHPNKKTGVVIATSRTEKATLGEESSAQLIATHIALKKPMAVTTEEVIDILQPGGKKIPNVEKIAVGKALMTQPFSEKEGQTVQEYIQSHDPELIIKTFLRVPQTKK